MSLFCYSISLFLFCFYLLFIIRFTLQKYNIFPIPPNKKFPPPIHM